LLHADDAAIEWARTNILAQDRSQMPGMVRASFGMYNTADEVDHLIDALTRIAQGDIRGRYVQELVSGDYHPQGWTAPLDEYFSL
jgi:hypothetical protein